MLTTGYTANDSKFECPDVTVVRNGNRPKVRKSHTMSGLVPRRDFRGPNHNVENLARAAIERVFLLKDGSSPPLPTPKSFFRKELREFRGNVVRACKVPPRWSWRQFVTSYHGRKLTLYENALDRLLREGPLKKDSVLSCFIKMEKVDLSSKPDAVPRIISPRSPKYNIQLGRYIKPAEGVLYRAVNEVLGYTAIAKGMNCVESAACLHANWLHFSNPRCIPLDVTRFDQHVSFEALKYEHSFYLALFNHDPELKKLLGCQLKNTYYARANDGVVKYTTRGKRSSGDMNTALGNVLLMVSMTQSYCAKKRLDVRLFDNGDDCCVILNHKDVDKFNIGLTDYFRGLGFTLKVEAPVATFEKIDFCQASPVWDGSRYRMVRNARTAFHKDVMSIHPRNSVRDMQGWMGASGEGGLALTSGIPCYQAFYNIFIRSSRGLRAKTTEWELQEGKYSMGRGLCAKYVEPSPRSRYSFWLAFGITPDQQLNMEHYFNSIPPSTPTNGPTKLLVEPLVVEQPFTLGL